MSSDATMAPQIAEKMRELTLSFGRVVVRERVEVLSGTSRRHPASSWLSTLPYAYVFFAPFLTSWLSNSNIFTPQKAKATVHHRRKQSGGSATAAATASACDSDPQGSLKQMVDAYGFEIGVSLEQEAALELCLAQEQRQRVKWAEFRGVAEGTLPPEDRLKKLCRKVGV